MPFYGLYIPVKGATSSGGNNAGSVDIVAANEESSGEQYHVFRGKHEALEVLKQHKDARLREFTNEEDAIKYAQTGYEVVQTKYADVKTPTSAVEKAAFRAPTKQELIEFRKFIEAGDFDRVKSMIWENPRYLVSSGDTPTTLKEGYRYNAMHICAISMKPRIAELILQTVSNPKFVDLLTGKRNDHKMCLELCANLLDYYLNIPEKGRSETPLHFAAKNGSVEMIEVLTSYAECRMQQNCDGKRPKDIICSRAANASPELIKKIEFLLSDRYYVPVLRSMDTAIPPHIGPTFSATSPPVGLIMNTDPLGAEVKIQALAGPMTLEHAQQFRRRWKTPPRIGSTSSLPIGSNLFISPIKSPMQLRAFNSTPTKRISPVTKFERRALFNSSLQVTPLQGANDDLFNGLSLIRNTLDDPDASFADQQNGNHKSLVGDSLSAEMETNNNISTGNNNRQQQSQSQESNTEPPTALPPLGFAKPQNKFLKNALNIPATPVFQMKRELFYTYREQQFQDSPIELLKSTQIESIHSNNSLTFDADGNLFPSPAYKERHIKITDIEKGLEIIGRELAKEQNIEWREYWDFLNSFADIAGSDGLQDLENYLMQRTKETEASQTPATTAQSSVILNDVCNALEKFSFSKENDNKATHNGFGNERYIYKMGSNDVGAAPQATTPYTCVEKSLQVFAKRITKTIVHNVANVVSINDVLLSELKRLKSLICSFKEDVRFLNVDFAKVHSRIGNLVSIYIEHSQEVTPDIKVKIQNIINNLILTSAERREHMECVCARISCMLKRSHEQILPENLKTEEMCSKIWIQESECECQWENNLSRKTSRRNRIEARYRTHQQQVKQLEKEKKLLAGLSNADASGNESSDGNNDEVFWSDFGDSDSGNEAWFTPPDTPSRLSLYNEPENLYSIYIYGNEPTKRDLDVLNAIFHVDIDKEQFPHIHCWKTALLCFTNEEMDFFPSPSNIKKSHVFSVPSASKTNICAQRQPTPHPKAKMPAKTAVLSHNAENPEEMGQSGMFHAKCLFGSPIRTKPAISEAAKQQLHSQPLATPLNKIRGLFSAYRERIESTHVTPLGKSPPNSSVDMSSSDAGLQSLSLLNVSATE